MHVIHNNLKFFSILCVIFLFLVSVNSVLPHQENDEKVYLTLTEKISCREKYCIFPDLRRYTLQNTAILRILDRTVYDKPLFFRPPAFIYTLAILYPIIGKMVFYIMPPLLYTTMAVLIYECMYVLTGSGRTALKAMILSIFNPFLLFHAFRIWTDLFMTFFIFLSFLFAVKFKYEKKLPIFAFLSGLALTVAVLTKYQALLAIPLILFFIVKSLKKEQIPAVLAAFLIPFLLLFYWLSFLLPYKPTLQYLLSNTPSAEVLSKYPFVAYVAKRPVYYYFLSLFTVNPVNLILFVPLVRAIRTGYRPVLFTPIVKNIVMPILLFIVIVLLIFTVIGTSGSTFQSRYVLMTQPFLVLLVSLVPLRRVFLRVATGSVVFFTVLMASINIVSRSAELFSLPEMLFR